MSWRQASLASAHGDSAPDMNDFDEDDDATPEYLSALSVACGHRDYRSAIPTQRYMAICNNLYAKHRVFIWDPKVGEVERCQRVKGKKTWVCGE